MWSVTGSAAIARSQKGGRKPGVIERMQVANISGINAITNLREERSKECPQNKNANTHEQELSEVTFGELNFGTRVGAQSDAITPAEVVASQGNGSSPQRILANRENSKYSTGPKTSAGQSRGSAKCGSARLNRPNCIAR